LTNDTAGLTHSEGDQEHATHERHCSSCRCGQNDPELRRCPLCGGELIVGQSSSSSEQGAQISLSLVFARIICEQCGQAVALRHDRRCVVCGEAHRGEAATARDPAVQARRAAFKRRLLQLAQRAVATGLGDPKFARKGATLSLTEHLGLIRQSIARHQDLSDALRKDLAAVHWDAREPECIPFFHRVVGELDQQIDLVADLLGRVPPVDLRAPHRILARALAEAARGYLSMTMALVATDPEAALARRDEGQALITEAAAILERFSPLLQRIAKAPPDSAWMAHDVLDFATVAWEGVGNRPTSISAAADVVRSALSMIPGIPLLHDAYALQLLPATVFGLRVADPTLLAKRAVLIRSLLDEADGTVAGWIGDPSELTERISVGVRAVIELAERVGFASLGAQSRRMMLQLLINVYGSLVEGPVRDLGGALVIAIRARRGDQRNASYERMAARGIQAGDVVQELGRIGGPWDHAVDLLIRNAGAHSGATITDTGVRLTQQSIKAGVLVDEKTVELTDAEVVEEFACLQETVLALQLGIFPWLMTHADPKVAAAVASVQPTEREREAIIRLLAGLGGLLDVEFQQHGSALRLNGRLVEAAKIQELPKVPSLVAAIFGAWKSIDEVTVALESREPVTFFRHELPNGNPADDLPAVGLITRKWLGELPSNAARLADLVYLVKPQLNVIVGALSESLPPNDAGLNAAETRLRVLAERIDRAELPPPTTGLVNETHRLIRQTARALARFREAVSGPDKALRVSRARAVGALALQVQNADQRAVMKWKELTSKASAQVPNASATRVDGGSAA